MENLQEDMQWAPDFRPQLRPVEPFRMTDGPGDRIGLRDPSGISSANVIISEPALHILALMDGTNTCSEIQEHVRATLGVPLGDDALTGMLTQLEKARFLEGPSFESFYQAEIEGYRKSKTRGVSAASAAAPAEILHEFFDQTLAEADAALAPGKVVGLIAPHLDYPRGLPCYAAAYAHLREMPTPDRVIILGTNHFGRSTSVVATANSFETPLGTTPTDVEFIERLEDRCGNLRTFELDHAREHSVELQVMWLQHLFGANAPKIVPLLCPDPCGATGTAPRDGNGVDLKDFAQALGDLVRENECRTLLVAGADLSHVGRAFGDDRTLDHEFLDSVRVKDRRALDHLTPNDPTGWIRSVAESENGTRICSGGCVFALASALRGASGTILRYHQAVDEPTQTCVTSAAVAFTCDE